jgi:hypothetical protein
LTPASGTTVVRDGYPAGVWAAPLGGAAEAAAHPFSESGCPGPVDPVGQFAGGDGLPLPGCCCRHEGIVDGGRTVPKETDQELVGGHHLYAGRGESLGLEVVGVASEQHVGPTV